MVTVTPGWTVKPSGNLNLKPVMSRIDQPVRFQGFTPKLRTCTHSLLSVALLRSSSPGGSNCTLVSRIAGRAWSGARPGDWCTVAQPVAQPAAGVPSATASTSAAKARAVDDVMVERL